MIRHRRASLTSEKLIRDKKRKRWIFLIVFIVCVLLSLACVFLIFRSPYLKITEVQVEGNEIVSEDNLRSIAEALLGETYFIFIPKSNRLIYPKEEIETKIRKEVGRIETIELEIDNHVLHIRVGERGSYAIWCQDNEECYFIDSEGLIFSKAPTFSSGVYKRFTGVVSDEEPLGKQFLDSNILAGIKSITDYLLEQGWNTEVIRVATLRDVLLVQDKGPNIKVDLTKPASETERLLKTLLSSAEFHKAAKDFNSVEYIDARFGSKVFFKQKGSAFTSSTTPDPL